MGRRNSGTHIKRRAIAGLCAGILLAFAAVAYAGCAGDCITCHPKLKGDKDHLALATCITCHTPAAKQNLLEFGGGSAEECGNDCFQCHNQWPPDGNHAPLDTCGECHQK